MRGTQVIAYGPRKTGEQGVLILVACLGLVVAPDEVLANLPGSSRRGGEAARGRQAHAQEEQGDHRMLVYLQEFTRKAVDTVVLEEVDSTGKGRGGRRRYGREYCETPAPAQPGLPMSLVPGTPCVIQLLPGFRNVLCAARSSAR